MSKGWALPLCGFLLGCSADSTPATPGGPLVERSDAIVYGNDDRRDLYEEPAELRAWARDAIVGLLPKSRLQFAPSGEVRLGRLGTVPLGVAYNLCDGERFFEQPTAADCTGVLIDDDLVLTAGHCFKGASHDDDQECAGYYFVFDYFYRAAGQLEPISAADVHTCRKLVALEMSQRNGREIDYAVVQLDRPAFGRKPLALRTQAGAVDQPLVVLGMGSGLPIKSDRGARLVDARAVQQDFFMLEADTFEGSSGSAILDLSGALLGVLVRGGADYVPSQAEDCQKVNRLEKALVPDLATGELAHEEGTYALNARNGLCASGFPSVRLCDIEPRCGDTFCSGEETRQSCAEDCDPCDGLDCGARGTQRASARDAVKRGSGSGRRDQGSCAVPSGPARPAGYSAFLALACGLLLWRRRRS